MWFYLVYSYQTIVLSIPLRCAEESGAAGYNYFGILNYAQCWVRTTPSAVQPNFHYAVAPKDKCFGPNPDSRFACDKQSLGPCVGIPDYQYIYGVEQGLFVFVVVLGM